MPAPIENAKRAEIVQRHEEGESLRSISEEMKLSYETVKGIWRHWKQYGHLEPNYEGAKWHGTRKYEAVYTAALEMKRAHRRWGATLILLKLQESGQFKALPSVRTLQRWMRAEGVNTVSESRVLGQKRVKRGQEAHGVWAVDAKEQMQLMDGSWASWLLVSDEGSGAILSSEVFPPTLLDESGGQRRAAQSESGL